MVSSTKKKRTPEEMKVLKDRWRRWWVRFGQVTFAMSLGHQKKMMFNKQLAVHNTNDNSIWASRQSQGEEKRGTEMSSNLPKVTQPLRGRGGFIQRHSGSRAHMKDVKLRRELP